ncbi:MAG: hypothetical protein ABIE68_02670 [bacterium]
MPEQLCFHDSELTINKKPFGIKTLFGSRIISFKLECRHDVPIVIAKVAEFMNPSGDIKKELKKARALSRFFRKEEARYLSAGLETEYDDEIDRLRQQVASITKTELAGVHSEYPRHNRIYGHLYGQLLGRKRKELIARLISEGRIKYSLEELKSVKLVRTQDF